LPLVPVLLAVVFLGFAVGAVLSMLNAQRIEEHVAQATATPQATTTPPYEVATPRPFVRPKFTPYPAVVPTIAHTPPPAVVQASSEPDAETTDAAASPAATPARERTSAPRKTESPATLASAAALPPEPTQQVPSPDLPPTPTPVPLPTARAVSASAPAIEADSEFAQEAAQAVRAYLTALQRGDEENASAALKPGLSLSEEAFMSRAARITRIHATGTSTAASVQARIVASQDAYAETFSVERGPRGPVILSHDFRRAK
jgi:hypothetical protein